MLTTVGTLDPPLGNARLQASKLIAAILATNSDTINAELANLGTLQVLWVGVQFTSIIDLCFIILHMKLLSLRSCSIDWQDRKYPCSFPNPISLLFLKF